MTNYIQTLVALVPDAQISYTGVAPLYEEIIWFDSRSQPTKEECDAAWPGIDAAAKAEEQRRVEAFESARAKLQALGLTVDEINTLTK